MKFKDFQLNQPERFDDVISDFMLENSDYDGSLSELKEFYGEDWRVYRYEFPHKPVDLIEDQRGCVRIEYSGRCVGYAKDDDCAEILSLMSDPSYECTYLSVETGNYVELYEDEETGRTEKRNGIEPDYLATISMKFTGEKQAAENVSPVQQTASSRTNGPVRSSAMYVFVRVLAVVVTLLGLLLCVVNPIVGIISIGVGVALFFYAKTFKPDK